jgi:hypothetical protein
MARVELQVALGDGPIADMWLSPGRVGGFDFVALQTAEDIAQEAVAMRNCLRNYGLEIARNWTRLWSVQKNGERVATLAVGSRYRNPLVNLVEVKAADNAKAPVEIWWAARQWLYLQDSRIFGNEVLRWDAISLDRHAWVSMWRPYWLAKQKIPAWLPLRPSVRAVDALWRDQF